MVRFATTFVVEWPSFEQFVWSVSGRDTVALKMMKAVISLIKRPGNSCVSHNCSRCLSYGMQHFILYNLEIRCSVLECHDSVGK